MPLPTVEAFLEARLAPDVRRLVLACSGGLDSVVLLHLLSALRPRFAFDLHVAHVHHGLHHDADHWLSHVAALAACHGAGFSALRVKVDSGAVWKRRPAPPVIRPSPVSCGRAMSCLPPTIRMTRPKRFCCGSCAAAA